MLLNRLIHALCVRGFRRTWKNIVGRFRWRTFVVYRLDGAPRLVPPAGVEFRTGLDALRRARAGHCDLPYQFFLDQSLGCERCYLALIGDRPVTVIWACPQASDWLCLAPNHLEMCGAATLPEARGRGIASALKAYACADLMATGVQRIYSVVEQENRASKSMNARTGSRPVATLRRPAIFGPRFCSDVERPETWAEAFRRLSGAPHSHPFSAQDSSPVN